MKKFLVMMYQEGASLLDFENRVGSNFALRRMVADAMTAATAFAELGAEVFVCDVYCRGRDIYEEEFSAPATKVKLADLEKLCLEGLTGVALIGIHAMNGAADAFYSYTVNETAWHEYYLNGNMLGDIGIAAAYFGAFNIPIIAVSGDKMACEEAKSLLGDLPCAIVKTALKRNVAKSLTEEEAKEEIGKACQMGAEKAKQIAPYVVEQPCEVKVRFNRVDFCDDCMSYNFGVAKRIAPLVAAKTIEKICKYDDLRI
jgi:D-amino peptidase